MPARGGEVIGAVLSPAVCEGMDRGGPGRDPIGQARQSNE